MSKGSTAVATPPRTIANPLSEEPWNVPEGETFSVPKPAPDREILQDAVENDGLTVSHPQSGYEYKWVHINENARDFISAQRLGWEAVTGNEPESPHLKRGPEGFRKIGDVVLMRTSKERADELRLKEHARNVARQENVDGALAEKAARAGIKVGEVIVQDTKNAPASEAELRRRLAAQLGAGKFEDQIRTGSVPGMRVRST